MPLAGQYVPLARLAADNLAASRFGKSFARSGMRSHFHRGCLWLIDHRIARQLFGRHNHNQTSSLHAGGILDGAGLRQLFNDGIHHGSPHFLIGHLPPAIREGDFGFITLFEECFHLPNFNFKVMFIGSWAQLDFLHLRGLLMAPTLMVLFAQLILVLPKVHNSTDRGGGVRSHFHQVIAAFLSLSKGVRRLKDAELFSFRANDTNFSDSDLTIHTQFGNDRPPLF